MNDEHIERLTRAAERIADALEGIHAQLEDMNDGTTTSDELSLLRQVLEAAQTKGNECRTKS